LHIATLNTQLHNNELKHHSLVEGLHAEINSLRHNWKSDKHEIRVFDDALKEQIEENKKLKAAISNKNEEVLRLKD
jgi:hypothetical protein